MILSLCARQVSCGELPFWAPNTSWANSLRLHAGGVKFRRMQISAPEVGATKDAGTGVCARDREGERERRTARWLSAWTKTFAA